MSEGCGVGRKARVLGWKACGAGRPLDFTRRLDRQRYRRGKGVVVKTGDAPQARLGISWRDAGEGLICLRPSHHPTSETERERRGRERRRDPKRKKKRRPQKKTPKEDQNAKQRWQIEEICIFFAFSLEKTCGNEKFVVPLHAFSACERYGYAQMHIFNSGTRPMSDGIFIVKQIKLKTTKCLQFNN